MRLRGVATTPFLFLSQKEGWVGGGEKKEQETIPPASASFHKRVVGGDAKQGVDTTPAIRHVH